MGLADIEECSHVFSQLSSVHCDIAEFGRQSAKILMDWLDTKVQTALPDRAPINLEGQQSNIVL